MSDTDENASTEWEDLTEVGTYPSLDQAQEHGLVILAMRQPCWVAAKSPEGEFSLHAAPEAAPAISRELDAYDKEQSAPKPPPLTSREIFRYPAGWDVYGLWLLALLGVFLLQATDPSLTDRAASSSRGLFANHEWWRPFTALFLHADLSHLVGNLLSGLFFGTLVARSIGPWLGWALILICGTLGNILTSLITWPEDYISIGASSAVFGALGILSGIGFSTMLRHRVQLPWARTAAPILAGIVLLGWFGGGEAGGNTDVLGHVCGFSSGIAAGFAVARITHATGDPSRDGSATAAHDGSI